MSETKLTHILKIILHLKEHLILKLKDIKRNLFQFIVLIL